MSLSIGVHAGQSIKVGEAVLKIVRIVRDQLIEVEVGARRHLLTEDERTEILPDVYASYGTSPSRQGTMPRIAFEAPRTITIQRLGYV